MPGKAAIYLFSIPTSELQIYNYNIVYPLFAKFIKVS